MNAHVIGVTTLMVVLSKGLLWRVSCMFSFCARGGANPNVFCGLIPRCTVRFVFVFCHHGPCGRARIVSSLDLLPLHPLLAPLGVLRVRIRELALRLPALRHAEGLVEAARFRLRLLAHVVRGEAARLRAGVRAAPARPG